MDEEITSSSNRPYALFIKKLDAVTWVQTGIDHYAYHEENKDGLCPFCKQKLPKDFKQDIADLFNEDYARNMAKLNAYLDSFKQTLSSLYISLRELAKNPFPAISTSALNAQVETLGTVTQECLNTIRDKIANPSGKYTLPDIRSAIELIEQTVKDLNAKIEENNKLFKERSFIAFLYFYYDMTSFFLVRKEKGHSESKLCVRPCSAGQHENYNPVKNSYFTLWSEYRELSSPSALINVMHQILEYYFVQLCGYDGEKLINTILKEREDKFFNRLSDGTLDTSEYNLAGAFISKITTPPSVIAEEHFIEDESDLERYRDIFERIFRAMDQQQHFDMMMESVNWNKS